MVCCQTYTDRGDVMFNTECQRVLYDQGAIDASTKDRVVGIMAKVKALPAPSKKSCVLPTVNSHQSVSHRATALVTPICRRKTSIVVICPRKDAQPAISFVDLPTVMLDSTSFCKLQEKSMSRIPFSPLRQQNGDAFPTSSTTSYPNVGMATPRRD